MNIQSLVELTTGQQKSPLLTTQNTATSVLRNEDVPAATDITESTAGEEFDTFLTLLTAQIRNQDPLAPLDSTQFVEQLATFSQLELQAKGNQELAKISTLLAQNLYGTNNPVNS